jgi:hypothetical protein
MAVSHPVSLPTGRASFAQHRVVPPMPRPLPLIPCHLELATISPFSPMIWCSILPQRISFPFAADIYGKMVGSLILRMRDDFEPDSFPSLLYRYHPTHPRHRLHTPTPSPVLSCSSPMLTIKASTPPRHRPWSGTSGAPPTTPRTPPKSREPTVAYQRSLCLNYVLRRCLNLAGVLRTAVLMAKWSHASLTTGECRPRTFIDPASSFFGQTRLCATVLRPRARRSPLLPSAWGRRRPPLSYVRAAREASRYPLPLIFNYAVNLFRPEPAHSIQSRPTILNQTVASNSYPFKRANSSLLIRALGSWSDDHQRPYPFSGAAMLFF